ncbi:MAG: peptide/nickel transport system substrate-binding protein [Chloroflexota bacterium]|nr:peptide/nickel transport system substrate-binding protein [Chloroflexota bacterium]
MNQKKSIIKGKTRITLLISLMLISAMVLGACSSAAGDGAESDGAAANVGQVIVVQSADPSTLDPQKAGGSAGGNIAFNIFEGLTKQSEDMTEVLPALATEWYAVDDTTWEFKLREGVKFQNGEDFNAEAVKYTVDRMLDPDEANDSSSFKTIQEAVVVDDFTVQLITTQPDPLIPAKVFGLLILPPQYTAEAGSEEFGQHPVGTGPFKLAEFTPNQRIVLEANDDYWGGRPSIDTLIFRPVAEASTRLAELLTGEADIVLDISPEDIPTVEEDADVRIEAVDSKRVPYIGMDLLDDGPEFLKDVRVRQALNYAVDVDAIIDTILSGYATRLATIYRTDFVGFDDTLEPYAYDPDKAKELLTDAGYGEGDITLKITANGEIITKGDEIGEAIAGMLQEVGINAEVDLQSYQGIRDMYIGGQEAHLGDALFVWNWGSREPDANSPLSGTLQSGGITSYYRDETLDAMIADAASTVDTDERIAKHKAIQAYIYEQAPFIFLYDAMDIYGVNNKISWTPRRDQYILGAEMSAAE